MLINRFEDRRYKRRVIMFRLEEINSHNVWEIIKLDVNECGYKAMITYIF